eukprot:15179083-Alexandrium_andersonii.AAC.1
MRCGQAAGCWRGAASHAAEKWHDIDMQSGGTQLMHAQGGYHSCFVAWWPNAGHCPALLPMRCGQAATCWNDAASTATECWPGFAIRSACTPKRSSDNGAVSNVGGRSGRRQEQQT